MANSASAQCNPGVFFIDLKSCLNATTNNLTGVTVLSCAPLAANPAIAACPASANWKQAVLKVNIPTNCTQAIVQVEYEGLPASWTFNLGDSPTNDGFAGDAGSPDSEAELQIFNESLDVYTAALGPGVADQIAHQDLSVTDSALKFVVKNNYVSWGQPFSFVQTQNLKKLFLIPDAGAAAADRRVVYVGLNRVIAHTSRQGCGARRALVSFK
ncbi:MAG TPA: hypothetical protein VF789_05300 [Thermoanaerobaculia bacterium]